MRPPDGQTASLWLTSGPVKKSAGLGRSPHCDVCVVGAGISGLTAAYLLLAEGRQVIVLDEGPIGGGQTGRTSAHLASALDDRFFHMERSHGQEAVRLAYRSHAEAIDLIEQIVRAEKITCDFARVNGYLGGAGGKPESALRAEFDASKRVGVPRLAWLASNGLNGGLRIRFGNQARFHPARYLTGLARAVRRMGGVIHLGQRVRDVQGADFKTGKLADITLAGGQHVRSREVVVATNTPAPINDWFGIYTKQAAYRSYVIAAAIPRGSVEDALHWDMSVPYHYVRVQRSTAKTDLLLIGGEDHRVGQPQSGSDPFAALEAWGRERFPTMGQVRYRWSGQVQEPADGLAFIGRALTANEGVFVITGDSGMGLTHGTIGGRIVADLILGRENRYAKLYDPSRKIANATFLKDSVNVVSQYRDWISPAEIIDVRQVARGEGAILRKGFKKIAVYRDPKGKVHKLSAACTHLQCVVHWNAVEKTWDCPCHGGRFDPTGKVLMGPPIDDLAPEK